MSRTCLGGLPLALGAAALLAAGCGSSSSSSGTTAAASTGTTTQQSTATAPSTSSASSTSSTSGASAPLTQAELVAKANTICTVIATKRNRLQSGSEAEFDLIVPQVAAYQQALVIDFRKITPPASLAGRWSEIIRAAQTMAESTQVISQDVHAGHVHTSATSPLFADFANARLQLRALAKRAGISGCAVY